MHWQSGWRQVAFTLAVVVLQGCDADELVTPDTQRARSAATVARGIAQAMNDPNIRVLVRDAMRRSLLVDHKVPLKEFLATPEGRIVQARAAATLRMAPERFEAIVESLPEMDFLVPRREDRLAWRTTSALAVATTLDNDAPPTMIYLVNGAARPYAPGAPEALFLIEPREGQTRRIRPQPDRSGEAIQDASDGEGGGVFTLYDATGRILRRIELADLVDAANATTESDVAYGYGSSDTTYVDYFWTDANDGAGTMEIEFRAKYYDESNTHVASATLRKEGLDSLVEYFWHEKLIHARIVDNTIARIRLNIVETDAFFDDDMGTRDFTWGDNGQTRSLTGSGDNSNIKLGWTAVAGASSNSWATIVGPTSVKPMTCHWSVSTNVSGNVQWLNGETVLGTGADLYYAPSASFTLQVLTWNSSTGAGAEDEIFVSVSSSNEECNDQ
jgi:hypothetical protein